MAKERNGGISLANPTITKYTLFFSLIDSTPSDLLQFLSLQISNFRETKEIKAMVHVIAQL